MAESKIPNILWAEDPNKIYLRCTIRDCLQPEKIIVSDKVLTVTCYDKQTTKYEFSFELLKNVNEQIDVNITNNLLLTLQKSEPSWWKHLTNDPQYKKYIKVDWDRWQDSEDEEEEVDTSMMGGMGPGMGGLENMEEMMRLVSSKGDMPEEDNDDERHGNDQDNDQDFEDLDNNDFEDLGNNYQDLPP